MSNATSASAAAAHTLMRFVYRIVSIFSPDILSISAHRNACFTSPVSAHTDTSMLYVRESTNFLGNSCTNRMPWFTDCIFAAQRRNS